METNSILFNVIVPTRERAETLRHSLRTITSQAYDNLRIIVSDNASRDNTKEIVDRTADARLTYVNPGRRLSMAHHWEFALSHVTDGWVMFIGDDDGLCPGALAQLDRLIRETGVDAVNSAFSLFVWPGHMSGYPSGKLVVPLGTGSKVKTTLPALDSALRGTAPYTTLPWLYNGGAASIRAINRARRKDGNFFCAQTPDLYSAVALSLSLDRFLTVNFPIAVGGTSRHSTGASTLHTNDKSEKKAAEQYSSEDNIPFHRDLILGSSVDIVLYECYLQAAHLHVKGFSPELARQLQVAIDNAAPSHFQQTLANCQDMAKRHGIRLPRARRSPARLIRRSVTSFRRVMNRYVIDPGSLGLMDVNAAATATSAIHHFATSGPIPKGLVKLFLSPRELRAVAKARARRTSG